MKNDDRFQQQENQPQHHHLPPIMENMHQILHGMIKCPILYLPLGARTQNWKNTHHHLYNHHHNKR
eukprot:11994062-Ditylum_brightwellii.AAC.1